MGFPNPGADVVAERLRVRSRPTIVGVNVGRSKVVDSDGTPDDYAASIRALAPLADYLVLNVSSPNTPGLRDLQAVDRLGTLVEHARRTAGDCSSVPILVKIAPDLDESEIDDIADLALRLGVDGIIAVNTTVRPGLLRREYDSVAGPAGGGLSGAPLKERALEVLRRLYARVGSRVCLVSVGGIETADDAWDRIACGATLVQAYTGFVYGGPSWPRSINRGLARRAREAGLSSIQELVGTAVPADRGTFLGRPSARDRPSRGVARKKTPRSGVESLTKRPAKAPKRAKLTSTRKLLDWRPDGDEDTGYGAGSFSRSANGGPRTGQ